MSAEDYLCYGGDWFDYHMGDVQNGYSRKRHGRNSYTPLSYEMRKDYGRQKVANFYKKVFEALPQVLKDKALELLFKRNLNYKCCKGDTVDHVLYSPGYYLDGITLRFNYTEVCKKCYTYRCQLAISGNMGIGCTQTQWDFLHEMYTKVYENLLMGLIDADTITFIFLSEEICKYFVEFPPHLQKSLLETFKNKCGLRMDVLLDCRRRVYDIQK